MANNLETFSAEFKRDCLAFLLKDAIAAKAVILSLPLDFFEYDPEYHTIYIAFREFIDKYKSRPSRHELVDLIKDQAEKDGIEEEDIKGTLKALQEVWDWSKFNPLYVKDKLYDAIKAHHVLQVARQIDEYVDEGDYDGLVEAMSKARFQGSEEPDLVEYWGDMQKRVKRVRRKKAQYIPSGLSLVDAQIDGGLPKGNIAMVMGGSGFGKSAMLGQFALASSMAGFTTAYLTLELSADLLMSRCDSHNTGIPLSDITKIPSKKVKKKIKEAYHAGSVKPAPLYVQYFPTKSVGIHDIEAYVQRLREEKGITLDALFVDYFDLLRMVGDYTKKYEALEENIEMLRGLAGQYDMAVWTASQVNRSGIGKDDVDMEDIAAGFGKVFPLDLLFTISQTKQERTKKVFRLTNAKSRLGPAGTVLWVEPDFSRMRFTAFDEDEAKTRGLYLRKKTASSSGLGTFGTQAP